MKRLITVLASLVATAIVVSACSGPEVLPPPPTSVPLEVNDGATPVHNGDLAAGRSAQFSLNAADSTDPLIVIELDEDLDLQLLDGDDGATVASSSSANYFAAGTDGLAGVLDGSASSGLGSSAIVTTAPCRGSCIVFAAGAGTRYFRVSNSGSANASYDVYLYGSIYTDTNEPNNDALADAVNYEPEATTNEGAIETVGDEDWWYIDESGEVDFDAGGDAAIVMTIHEADGTLIRGPYEGGRTPYLNAGEYVRVYSSLSRAGRGASGYYYLTAPLPITVPLAAGSSR